MLLKILMLICISNFVLICKAQKNIEKLKLQHSIQLELNGGVSFYNYTNNSLVSSNKYYKPGSGSSFKTSLLYCGELGNAFIFSAGVGIANHYGDLPRGHPIILFGGKSPDFLWISPNNADTVNIEKLNLHHKSFVFPLKIGAKFKIGTMHSYIAFLVVTNNYIFYKSNIGTTLNNTPSANAITALQNDYNKNATKHFSQIGLGITTSIYISKKISFISSLEPITFYSKSFYTNFYYKQKSINLMNGIAYLFN